MDTFVNDFFYPTGNINRITFFRRTMALLGMYIVCFLLLAFIASYFVIFPTDNIGKMIVYLHNIVFIYSLIALAIKRLRDMKQLVWWSLLLLIPYLNLLVYAVLLFARSKNQIWELD